VLIHFSAKFAPKTMTLLFIEPISRIIVLSQILHTRVIGQTSELPSLRDPSDSQHCFKAKHASHCAFACFEWLSASLYFALRHVVFRFVFLASVSATRDKTRKHEMQRVVSKRVFCLPSDIHLSL
jgi:hypothetical protein